MPFCCPRVSVTGHPSPCQRTGLLTANCRPRRAEVAHLCTKINTNNRLRGCLPCKLLLADPSEEFTPGTSTLPSHGCCSGTRLQSSSVLIPGLRRPLSLSVVGSQLLRWQSGMGYFLNSAQVWFCGFPSNLVSLTAVEESL